MSVEREAAHDKHSRHRRRGESGREEKWDKAGGSSHHHRGKSRHSDRHREEEEEEVERRDRRRSDRKEEHAHHRRRQTSDHHSGRDRDSKKPGRTAKTEASSSSGKNSPRPRTSARESSHRRDDSRRKSRAESWSFYGYTAEDIPAPVQQTAGGHSGPEQDRSSVGAPGRGAGESRLNALDEPGGRLAPTPSGVFLYSLILKISMLVPGDRVSSDQI